MKQCKDKTQTGERCKCPAAHGADYCFQHRHIDLRTVVVSALGGAAFGSAISGGTGALIGGIMGALLGTFDRK
ncbi:hypothetical protein HYR99_06570 [Candidatus Poribacteria bacterium]|nr:hypothetical protein [Candidatus Poribacteria bacterium]